MALESSDVIPGLLPVEIWEFVFEFLRWDSWPSLLALNLSCRDFHLMVSPILFRTVHIRFLDRKHIELGILELFGCAHTWGLAPEEKKEREAQLGEAGRKLNPLLGQDVGVRIHSHVRILTVSYGPLYNYESSNGESISRLVENLPNLEVIRWRGIAFPPGLLMNLRRRQSAPDLYFEGMPEDLVGDDLLMGAPYIRSLSITYTPDARRWPTHQPELNDKLGTVIASLPNLEWLTVQQYYISSNPFFKKTRPLFELPHGSTLPNLRVLSLSQFHVRSKHVAVWARCLRHGKLQQLSLSGSLGMYKLIKRLLSTGCVSRLKSLTIRVHNYPPPWFVSLLDRFLHHLSNLQAFEAWELSKDVVYSAVRHQGNHLRQLRVQFCPMPQYPGNPCEVDCTFSLEEIKKLSTELPLVERLGLTLRFDKSMPCEYLDSMARFPSLKHLELSTRIHYESWARPEKLWPDASVAEQAFRHVDRIKTGARLEGLEIRVGSWDRFPRRYSYLFKSFARSYGQCEGWIYACWRDTKVPDKVQVLRLPGTIECHKHLLADNVYEQTMYAAGLRDSSAEKIYGPALWRDVTTEFLC